MPSQGHAPIATPAHCVTALTTQPKTAQRLPWTRSIGSLHGASSSRAASNPPSSQRGRWHRLDSRILVGRYRVRIKIKYSMLPLIIHIMMSNCITIIMAPDWVYIYGGRRWPINTGKATGPGGCCLARALA